MITPSNNRRELKESHAQTSHANRRVAAALTVISISSLSIVALYQLGSIAHLPEPPLKILDADRIHRSPAAYKWLHTPDAILGGGSYLATLLLIIMGSSQRAHRHPGIPLCLAGKAVVDATVAMSLTVKSWKKFHAFSLYSLAVGAATLAVLPCVIPEAIRAGRGR